MPAADGHLHEHCEGLVDVGSGQAEGGVLASCPEHEDRVAALAEQHQVRECAKSVDSAQIVPFSGDRVE